MYRVTVTPSVNETYADDLMGKTAIVIDVLRETSSIITALHHGCSAVIPVETVYQAKDVRDEGVLLGGERHGKKIPGFDFGNSPLEYRTPELRGKTLVITTTNGTRAIHKSSKASHVIAAAMLNARAAARQALSWNKDVVIVCAGTRDKFSLEDGLCAGFIIREIEELCETPPELDDLGLAMRFAYERAKHRLEEVILSSRNGRRLAKIGLIEDVMYCCQTNIVDTVPMFIDGVMTSGVHR